MRICATSNGDQRVQVLILAVQEMSRRQRKCMHQYFELMDRQGLKLPAAKRRQQDTLEKDRTLGRCVERLECSVEVWKDFSLKKKYVTLGEQLPHAELLPAMRKEQSPYPKQRDASR